MRKAIKFIPAALAVFALASCSSDDLFEKSSQEVSSKYKLTVNIEDDAETRSGHVIVGTSRKPIWEAGDVIRTGDNSLGTFDEYSLPEGTAASVNAEFGLVGETPALTTHNYAVFPAENVKTLGWGKDGAGNKVAILTMNIPSTGNSINENNFANQATVNGEKVQIGHSFVPMWGPITDPTATSPAVSLGYMTAFLQIDLNSVPTKATKVTVYAFDKDKEAAPIAGRFEAALDVENPRDAVLAADAANYTYDNKIEIDLAGIDLAGMNGSIYVPIIAEQYYGNIIVTATVNNVVGVIKNYGPAFPQASYAKVGLAADPGADIASDTPAGWKNGTNYIDKLGGKVFAEGFTLPRGQAVKFAQTFNLTCTANTPSGITDNLLLYKKSGDLKLDLTAAVATSASDNIIEIPTSLSTSDITLNFNTSITASAAPLQVIGTCNSLTINTADVGAASAFNFTALKGNVILKGTAATKDFITVSGQNTAGYSLTVGKYAKVGTALSNNKANIVIAEDGVVTPNIAATTYNVTVNAGGNAEGKITTTTGNVEVAGTAGSTITTTTGNVTVSGTVADDITTTSGNITFTTGAAYAKKLETATGKITVDNLGFAVKDVEFTGAGSLDLKNGIIATLTTGASNVSVTSSGVSGITALAAGAGKVTFTSSFKYNEKNYSGTTVPTKAIYDGYLAALGGANMPVAGSVIIGGNNYRAIYTAAQLAACEAWADADYALATSITKLEKWQSPALAQDFDGNGFTIGSIDAPLFGTLTGVTVNDVTITNATIANVEGTDGVGILAKSTAGANNITITKVNVTGSIASKSGKDLAFAGGIIGKAAHTAGNLVIGALEEGTGVTATVSFTNNDKVYGESGRNVNAGTIGTILGGVDKAGNVELKANATSASTLTKSSTGLKFGNYRRFNNAYEITGWYKGNTDLIGRSTSTATGTITYYKDAVQGVYAPVAAFAANDFDGLTWDVDTKTVSGTLYFNNNADVVLTVKEIKDFIKTQKAISNDDYKTDGTKDIVNWTYKIVYHNTFEAAAY